eukprot:3792694-Prymnesium_polylepis.3
MESCWCACTLGLATRDPSHDRDALRDHTYRCVPHRRLSGDAPSCTAHGISWLSPVQPKEAARRELAAYAASSRGSEAPLAARKSTAPASSHIAARCTATESRWVAKDIVSASGAVRVGEQS